jgi:branched-chain amino acid transport system substrate-binding protein
MIARTRATGLAALTFFVFGVPCRGSTTSTATNTSPYRIGVSVPLTGAFAALTIPGRNGLQLWVNQVNSKGGLLGRKIELTIVDNKSDADTGVTIYQNFLSQNLDFIIELGTATLAERESTLAEQHKKLFFCPVCFDPALFQRGYEYMFGTNNGLTDSFSVGISNLVKLIPDAQRPKTVAYAYANASGPISSIKSFQQYLDAAGARSGMDTPYPLDINDATAIDSQLKRANGDFVFVNGYTNDEVLITKGIFQQGLHPKLMYISATATVLPNWGQLTGDGGQQVVYTAPWLPDRQVHRDHRLQHGPPAAVQRAADVQRGARLRVGSGAGGGRQRSEDSRSDQAQGLDQIAHGEDGGWRSEADQGLQPAGRRRAGGAGTGHNQRNHLACQPEERDAGLPAAIVLATPEEI